VPVNVRERVAVEQQYRRPIAADAPDDLHLRIGRLNFESLEAFVHETACAVGTERTMLQSCSRQDNGTRTISGSFISTNLFAYLNMIPVFLGVLGALAAIFGNLQ